MSAAEPGKRHKSSEGAARARLPPEGHGAVRGPPGCDSEGQFGRLLERFSQGDDSALGEILSLEMPRLRRRLCRVTPRRLLRHVGISDLLQLTAIELVRLRPRFRNRGRGPFRRLLYLLASRALAGALDREHAKKRSLSRQVTGSGASDLLKRLAARDPTPLEELLRLERIEAVRRSFVRLSAADQEILRLVDYDGRSYREVARSFGVTEEAARKRHSRAAARLRALLLGTGIAEA